MRTEPTMDAMRGCGSASGIRREVVLCAAQKPVKASAIVRESMMGIVFCYRREQSMSV